MRGRGLVEKLEQRAVAEHVEVERVGVLGELLERRPPGRMRMPRAGQPVLPTLVIGRHGPGLRLGLEQPPVPDGERGVGEGRGERREVPPGRQSVEDGEEEERRGGEEGHHARVGHARHAAVQGAGHGLGPGALVAVTLGRLGPGLGKGWHGARETATVGGLAASLLARA